MKTLPEFRLKLILIRTDRRQYTYSNGRRCNAYARCREIRLSLMVRRLRFPASEKNTKNSHECAEDKGAGTSGGFQFFSLHRNFELGCIGGGREFEPKTAAIPDA